MTTVTNEKRDSVSVSTRDTASKVTDIVQQNNIVAKDLDVVIEYAVDSAVKWTPYYKPRPTKITVHIASLKDSTRTVTHIDSAGVKTRDTTSVHTQINDVVKTVDRKGAAFGTYIVIGLLVIAGALFVYFKFIKL